jgi:hypothetical protein
MTSFVVLLVVVILNFSFRLEDESRADVRNKIAKEFPNKQPEEIDKILNYIELSLNPTYAHLLSVFRSSDDNAEVDVAILRALLKAVRKGSEENGSERYQAQLKLALAWNRIDIAKNFIFTDENKERVC